MSDRLDGLTDEQLETYISGLERDLQDLKLNEQVSGTGNVPYTQSTSTNTYDWSGTLPQDPTLAAGNGKLQLLVTLTGQTMSALYANIAAQQYTGSPLTAYGGFEYMTDVKNGAKPFGINTYDLPNASLSQATVNKVLYVLTYDTTTPAAVKFYVTSLDTVSISVVVV